MLTTATPNAHYSATEPVLFVAFELSEKTWKLGFTIGQGQNPRERTMVARDPKRLLDEVAQAKARLGLGATAPVVSCYEAGREGFWLHRFLQAHGITNQVVDSSSISEQIAGLEAERRALLRSLQEAHLEKVRQLMQLKGLEINGRGCG